MAESAEPVLVTVTATTSVILEDGATTTYPSPNYESDSLSDAGPNARANACDGAANQNADTVPNICAHYPKRTQQWLFV